MNPSTASPDSGVETLKTCIDAIEQAQTIVITSHAKPDGDAAGSCLALKRILDRQGKSVRVAGLAPIPTRYAGLAAEGEIEPASDVPIQDGTDLLIVLDASSIDRIPEEFRNSRGKTKILNMDHHVDNSLFGDINLLDSAASSTGEMVYLLAREGKYPLNREIAMLLWVAIVTDTGRFTHENTTPRAMHTAAELLAFDLPTEEIDRRIYRSLTPAELELKKRVLQSMEFHANGQVAFALLGRSDFAAAGCGPAEVNELVEIPRSAAGVSVAALFYEHDDHSGVKVSMRANAPYDVGEICRELGGGGHPGAAGCTLSTNMENARSVVLQKLVRKWFETSDAGSSSQ